MMDGEFYNGYQNTKKVPRRGFTFILDWKWPPHPFIRLNKSLKRRDMIGISRDFPQQSWSYWLDSENFCEILTHTTQFQNEILQNFKLYFHCPEASIYYMISWKLFCILNSKYLYLIKYKFKSYIHLKGSNRDRFYLKGGN